MATKQVIKGVPRSLRKIISRAVSDYCWELRVQQWNVGIEYKHEDKEQEDPLNHVCASIVVNRRYLEAVVSIYPYLVKKYVTKKYNEDEVRQVVAHEISHLVTEHFYHVATAPYRDQGEMHDAWETCTTVIGRLIHRLAQKNK